MTAQKVTLTIPWCRAKWNYRQRESTTQTVCKPCLGVSKTHDAHKVEEFITTLEKSLPQPLYWKRARKIGLLQGCSQWISHAQLRQEEKQICRLFEKHIETITPAIEEKRKVLIGGKTCPCEQNLQVLEAARSNVQRCNRRCANEYWPDLCASIHSTVETLLRPYVRWNQAGTCSFSEKKTAPLNFATGEIIQDRAQQTERWVEHYPELSAREYGVFGSIERHRVLTLDNKPTKVELKEALEWYSACARGKEGTTMMRDANIVTLYKNRPARRDCTNNYQGIEFPSIAIKLFARVVVKGLRVLAERFYLESWCGFPAKRSILLGLIACPARRSIRSVWSRLRRNGHKHYLHLNHLLGGTF